MLWRLKVYFQNQKYSIAKPTNPDQENVVAAALASKQTHQYFLSVIFFLSLNLLIDDFWTVMMIMGASKAETHTRTKISKVS